MATTSKTPTETRPAVVCFLIAKSGREEGRGGPMVLLQRRHKPDWQRGRLNGVGGRCVGGESPIEAAKREFEAATGIEFGDGWRDFADMSVVSDGAVGNVFFFVKAIDSPAQVKPTASPAPVFWFTLKDLDKVECVPDLRWLLPLALDDRGLYASVDDDPYGNKRGPA